VEFARIDRRQVRKTRKTRSRLPGQTKRMSCEWLELAYCIGGCKEIQLPYQDLAVGAAVRLVSVPLGAVEEEETVALV